MKKINNNTIFGKIINFFRYTIYIRIDPSRIILQDVVSEKIVEDSNSIGIGDKSNLVHAVGDMSPCVPADNENIITSKPFDFSKKSIEYSVNAEAALRYFIKKLSGISFMSSMIRPKIIFHIKGLDWQLRKSDINALEEIGTNAGARIVYIWTGSDLTPQQILNKEFPGDCWAGKPFK